MGKNGHSDDLNELIEKCEMRRQSRLINLRTVRKTRKIWRHQHHRCTNTVRPYGGTFTENRPKAQIPSQMFLERKRVNRIKHGIRRPPCRHRKPCNISMPTYLICSKIDIQKSYYLFGIFSVRSRSSRIAHVGNRPLYPVKSTTNSTTNYVTVRQVIKFKFKIRHVHTGFVSMNSDRQLY